LVAQPKGQKAGGLSFYRMEGRERTSAARIVEGAKAGRVSIATAR
jgi:hypothetical protein